MKQASDLYLSTFLFCTSELLFLHLDVITLSQLISPKLATFQNTERSHPDIINESFGPEVCLLPITSDIRFTMTKNLRLHVRRLIISIHGIVIRNEKKGVQALDPIC